MAFCVIQYVIEVEDGASLDLHLTLKTARCMWPKIDTLAFNVLWGRERKLKENNGWIGLCWATFDSEQEPMFIDIYLIANT